MNETPDARVRFLRQLFDDAPAIVVLTRGPKHMYEYLNKVATSSSGFRPDIIGKPLREGRPELAEQGYVELYDGVVEEDHGVPARVRGHGAVDETDETCFRH